MAQTGFLPVYRKGRQIHLHRLHTNQSDWKICFLRHDGSHEEPAIRQKRAEHAYWNDIVDRACTWALDNKMLGMVVTLSYDRNTKKFTPISAKLKEN